MSDEEMDDDFSELQQAHQYQQKPTVIELQEDLSDDDLDSDDELGGEVDLDDDDLDDDDDDIEEQHLQTYKTLLETVLAQKYDYNSYIQLVETAHELNDLDKIRESCELFSANFPIAPAIWLKWLRIESSIATNNEQLQRINKLFQRALTDYFSIPVALEYAKLASKLPNAESVWNEIVNTYSHDCMEGSRILKEWRQFYAENVKDSPEKSKRLLDTYLYELSLPLTGIEDAYNEFCEKFIESTEISWESVNEKYHKAQEYLYVTLQFENQLVMQDDKHYQEKAAVFAEYIDKCKSFLNSKMLQVLYERMVSTCCLDVSCWLKYVKYLQNRSDSTPIAENEKSLVFSQSVLDVLNRALRNCSWSHELYTAKLNEAEKQNLPKAEITEIAQQAFEATNSDAVGHLNIWLQYLSLIKRSTNVSNEKDVQLLRKTMELGVDALARRSADPENQFDRLCARIEYDVLKDAAQGYEYFNGAVMNPNNNYKANLWIEFAYLEASKSIDAARKTFRRAVKIADINDFDGVMVSWKLFEHSSGSLDQIKDCNETCKKIIDNYNQKLAQSRKEKPQHGGKPPKRKGDSSDATQKVPNKKQKTFEAKEDKKQKPEKVAAKKKNEPAVKNVQANQEFHDKDAVTVFLSNLSFDVTEDEIIDAFPELNIVKVNLVSSATGNKHRGFAYLELESAEEVTKALAFDRRPIGDRPVYVSRISRDKEARSSFKYATQKESKKIFVKGLPFDATKDELEELFGKCGKIKDTRLVVRKDGKFKGIVFIEYEEESAASKAVLSMDSFELRGFNMSVSISDPPPKNTLKPTALNKSKPFTSSQDIQRPPRSEAKPRLSFIPTSVQRNVAKDKPSTSAETNGGASTSAAKSNDYFRQLLMKK